jgi:hypothetical protein
MGLHGMASLRYQPQQTQAHAQAVANKCSMMSSKQELNEAAAHFLQHLRGKHPDWFQSGEDNAAWQKGAHTADGLSPGGSSGQGTGSPIRVHRGPGDVGIVPSAVAKFEGSARGSDQDESPFMVQDALPMVQSISVQENQQEPLQLTPTEQLEEGQVQDKGVWNAMYGGWRKFCALLWREALMTTR